MLYMIFQYGAGLVLIQWILNNYILTTFLIVQILVHFQEYFEIQMYHVILDFSVKLKTGSIPADIKGFQEHTGNVFTYNYF